MWTRWLPWKALVSSAARSLGFLDPVPILARLEKLTQPSEVIAPIELLRAGAVFHARGLVNARVLQYNLDWAWPYWVERQYDPADDAFIPRAFALTHVNLTHRNWTAVGVPGIDRHPLVDPRGLVTPLFDGWSLDAWLVSDDGEVQLPARTPDAEQELVLGSERCEAGLEVRTRTSGAIGRLRERVDVVLDGEPFLRLRVRAEGRRLAWLALALRPANPEGVASIDRVDRIAPDALRVNGRTEVRFDRPPASVLASTYSEGDVLSRVFDAPRADTLRDGSGGSVACPAGLATAVALFPPRADRTAEISVLLPLASGSNAEPGAEVSGPRSRTGAPTPAPDACAHAAWQEALEGAAELRTPDERFRLLYEAALRSLVLHSPGDVYPGPYTYKRFWFRDAAFIVDALCSVGLGERARTVLDRYPARQEASGYFHSQEGEWDSNGAALWAMERYLRLTGAGAPPRAWIDAVRNGAGWIARKRLSRDLDAPHAGLLPAGFSAEHLGPNDYYYWDDFWCAAGLQAAARLLRSTGNGGFAAARWADEARDLLQSVEHSLLRSPAHGSSGAVPASPYRPLDAGAVGSLAAGYPLQLWGPHDPRLLATADHLLERHTVDGGFFQDMIHSGINPYLTLHIAQVLLRAGDARHEALVRTVADLASQTGQWPEAVHPRTRGGAMGDGQHVWASAEWALMMRNWFVREEGDALVLGSGLPLEWVESRAPLAFGPAPTPHGPVDVRVVGGGRDTMVEWDADWWGAPPAVEVRLPGHRAVTVRGRERSVRVLPSGAGSLEPGR